VLQPPYEHPTTCVLNFDKFRKRDLSDPFSFKNVLHVGNTTTELSMQFEKSCENYRHISTSEDTNAQINELIDKYTPDFVFLNFEEPKIISVHTILRLRCMRAYIVSWSSRKLPLVDLHISKETLLPSFDKEIFNPLGPFILDHPDIVILHPSNVREQILLDLKTIYGPNIYIQNRANIVDKRQAELYRSAKIVVAFDDPVPAMVDQRKEILGCGVLCLSESLSPDDVGDVRWTDIDDLRTLIDKYLKDDAERMRIAKTACLRVHRYQTWATRMVELQRLVNAAPNTDLELV
jgi:hypothetical protein